MNKIDELTFFNTWIFGEKVHNYVFKMWGIDID